MATFEQIQEAVRQLTRKRLLVGIPQDKDPRPGEPIGNASLGYIHNFGSPARNIPARPHLIPGVEKAMDEIKARLSAGAVAALRGDQDAALQYMGQAGQAAVNSVTQMIHDKLEPPLQPQTIARRRIRSKGSTYRRKAGARVPTPPEDVTPLIDTASYIRSFTWVLRDRP